MNFKVAHKIINQNFYLTLKVLKNSIKFLTFAVISCIILINIKGYVGNLNPNDKEIIKGVPPFETSLERGRYAQAVSLAEDRVFNVDKYPSFLSPDIAWFNNHYYPTFPPLPSVVASLFYLIGKYLNLGQFFSFLPSAFVTLLAAYVVYLIGNKLRFSQNESLLAAVIFASCRRGRAPAPTTG